MARKTDTYLRKKVKRHLLANPHATITETALATGASMRTVSHVRKRMRDQSSLEKSVHDHTSGKTPSTELQEFEVTSTKELMAEVRKESKRDIEDLSDLDPAEMKQILAKIARSKVQHPSVIIAAIREKNRLDFDTQDRHELGPGPPLTREAAKDRVMLLMEAVGLELISECFEEFIRKIGVADDGELSSDTSEVTPAPVGNAPLTPSVSGVRDSESPISSLHDMGQPVPPNEYKDQS